MVTMERLKKGIQLYLEKEIIPSLGGWQKWMFGAGASILVNRAEEILRNLESMPVVKAMNIIQGDKVDIEIVYEAVREQAKNTPAVIEIPAIGTIRLGAADIDKIYQTIMEG